MPEGKMGGGGGSENHKIILNIYWEVL